jgi:hypothetical protein
MSDDFTFSRTGDPSLRVSATTAVAEHFGLSNPGDMRRVFDEMLALARAGSLSDSKLDALDTAVDMIQRLDAIDSPWVYGHRYMSHKFVSTDPVCHSCKNAVPHRTILICPTCGNPGPWIMEERRLASSHIHYLLVEQLRRLLENELVLKGGEYRADGTATAVPRGGAKSTWLCEIAASWLLMTRRSKCLLLLSNTIKQVTERAIEIRTELEVNQLLIADFGVQAAGRQDSRMWAQDDFLCANKGRLVARGAMQSMRGVKNNEHRPDVVIADDADDEKFLTTAEQARKLHNWWDSRVVPACHPNAVYCFHGTVLGEMALLWKALRSAQGATYKRRIFRAMNDRCGCNVCGMPAPRIGPFNCPVCRTRTTAIKPCSYWGARFTVEALEAVQRRIGHWAWQSEYMQEPHDDSTSWFEKTWLERSVRSDLAPLVRSARRIIPWSILRCALSGDEAVRLATLADPSMAPVPGDMGPYQVMVQAWDPAWARVKKGDQQSCWMAGVSMGLTWDDKLDIHFMNRDRGLAGNAAFREWMYRDWVEHGLPMGEVSNPDQCAMIVERNGGGVMFQFGVEEHWSSVPMFDHFTGAEKHDLTDGIPGLASWFKNDKVIIRAGGTSKQRELADELVYELRQSGKSQYTDMLMALWIGWAFINRWIRDVRDPARYDELARRRAAKRLSRKH